MSTVLKNKRLERGITQVEISKMIGVSVRTYQRVENLDRKPSFNVIMQLQTIFNESISKLLDTL